MKLHRRRPAPRPAPAFDRASNHPARQPATPTACQADYANGEHARQTLARAAG